MRRRLARFAIEGRRWSAKAACQGHAGVRAPAQMSPQAARMAVVSTLPSMAGQKSPPRRLSTWPTLSVCGRRYLAISRSVPAFGGCLRLVRRLHICCRQMKACTWRRIAMIGISSTLFCCTVEQDFCPSGFENSRGLDRCVLGDAAAPDTGPTDDLLPDGSLSDPRGTSAPTPPMDAGAPSAPEVTPPEWFDVTPPGVAAANVPVAAVSSLPGEVQIFWATDTAAIRTARRTSPRERFGPSFDITPPNAIAGLRRITAVVAGPHRIVLLWLGAANQVRSLIYDPSSDPAVVQPWHEVTPEAGAHSWTSIAAIPTADGSVSAYWVTGRGAVMGARYESSMPDRGWWPPEELAPAGTALEHLTAVSVRDRAVHLFWVAPNGQIVNTFCESLQGSSPRWTQFYHYPTFKERAKASDPAAVIDPHAGVDAGSTMVFWVPMSGRNANAYRVDPRGSMTSIGALELGKDEYDIPVTKVSALPGRNNTYVLLRSDARLSLTCQPSCGAPRQLADSSEPLGLFFGAVAIEGEPGRIALFHATSNGKIRAADFVGP